jgi:Protein of unknown function (DUF5818)
MRFMSLGSVSRAVFCFGLLAGVIAAQETTPPSGAPQGTAEQRRAGGQKSITGCLMKGDTGFVVKAADGTYQLNTDRDLSAYVGKQIRIESKWDVTGTLTNTPMESAAGSTSAAPSAAAGGPGTPAFVGDLHLHITGTVIGDCQEPK